MILTRFSDEQVRRVGPRSTVQMVFIDTWQLAGSNTNTPASGDTGSEILPGFLRASSILRHKELPKL